MTKDQWKKLREFPVIEDDAVWEALVKLIQKIEEYKPTE